MILSRSLPRNTERQGTMAGDGLGFSGAGAGMFNQLFDAGLSLGTQFGQQELLGVTPGVNQATRLGITTSQFTAAPAAASNTIGGIDQKTLLIGAGLIVAAIVLAKVL